MASIRKHWRFAIFLGLFVGVMYLPSITGSFLGGPAFWNSPTGAALRPNLRAASAILLAAGVISLCCLRATSMIAIRKVFDRTIAEPETDVSEEKRAIPGQSASIHAALIALGFARLGESEGPMGIRRGEVTTHWVYSIEQGRTRASITVWSRIHATSVVFRTDFESGATVTTHFPLGVRIKQASLWTEASKTSIEHVHRLHVEHVQEFEKTHGAPVQVGSMRQHIDLIGAFDRQYGPIVLKHLQSPNLMILIATLIIAGAILGGMFLMPRTAGGIDMLTDVQFGVVAFIGGVMLILMGIIEGSRLIRML